MSVSQTIRVVYSFTGQNAYPADVTLAQGRDGGLYGTSYSGGTNALGSVYRLNTAGTLTQTFSFISNPDGFAPVEGLTLAGDGDFYGTASSGGGSPYGTLFKISASGDFSVLHNFTGRDDGSYPSSAPIEAPDGSLYGTVAGIKGGSGGAAVYRFSRISGFTSIFQFPALWDTANPLIQGSDGRLYGTTTGGGSNRCGLLYKMSTAGVLIQTYSFPCGVGGSWPIGPLLQASDGNFYGMTNIGGAYGLGAIFRLTPNFKVVILHSFAGGSDDGSRPVGGFVQATDGNLYGTAAQGGTEGFGTLFQLSLAGAYKTLFSFRKVVGKQPYASLMQDTNGLLYGTATGGGASGNGTVYSLDIGAGPFIAFVRANGRPGQTVQILGKGFGGATGVSFNGVAATDFNVVTDRFMKVVVPDGATTGPVTVALPGGNLISNKNFEVLP